MFSKGGVKIKEWFDLDCEKKMRMSVHGWYYIPDEESQNWLFFNRGIETTKVSVVRSNGFSKYEVWVQSAAASESLMITGSMKEATKEALSFIRKHPNGWTG